MAPFGLGEDLADCEAELRTLKAEARAAYEVMDAATRWAATQTRGIKTLAEADAHTAGYDALLAGQVRLGQALGILSKDI